MGPSRLFLAKCPAVRQLGACVVQVKQETVKLLGKGDMYYNPPEHPPVTEPGRKALEAAHSYRKTLSGGVLCETSPVFATRTCSGCALCLRQALQ